MRVTAPKSSPTIKPAPARADPAPRLQPYEVDLPRAPTTFEPALGDAATGWGWALSFGIAVASDSDTMSGIHSASGPAPASATAASTGGTPPSDPAGPVLRSGPRQNGSLILRMPVASMAC